LAPAESSDPVSGGRGRCLAAKQQRPCHQRRHWYCLVIYSQLSREQSSAARV